MNKAKIYVASSWRNTLQPDVVKALRYSGHEVYDFRNPSPGNTGFKWSEIDPLWKGWSVQDFIKALKHPLARQGYNLDYSAMRWANMGVMVMPCGKSAHLEAGYFVGARKPLIIYTPQDQEPELMYLMATAICTRMDELLDKVQSISRLPKIFKMFGAELKGE